MKRRQGKTAPRTARWQSLGLAALLGAALAGLGACQDSNSGTSGNSTPPSTPLEIAGTYEDASGSPYTITDSDWTDASGTYAIVSHDNSAAFLIAQNDAANAASPGLWSRFDWTAYWSDLYVCHTADAAGSATDPELGTGADATSPAASGCGTGAWVHLVGPLPIIGTYHDNYSCTQVVSETTWTTVLDAANYCGGTYHVAEYWDQGQFLVAQNDGLNSDNPSKWSRFDWALDQGHLYYCQTAYTAATQADAMNTPRSDATNPSASGCGGAFPWTQLN